MPNTDGIRHPPFPQIIGISIEGVRAVGYFTVDPSLVYFPIICSIPSPGDNWVALWTTLGAEWGSEILGSQSGSPTFAVVAHNDQVVMVAESAGIHTVWSIEAIGGSSNVFKIWLSDQNLVWTLGDGGRIVLRPPQEGNSGQEIEFTFFA